ncbi:MAG TPA: 2-C-methyl-D-erythritol 4-phosphate cytidylyltransferase [Ktedonobacterales bacterium]|nr:2-C-methyl-D-erythritol 4-phosphate cytidylyltransferase [Ktedonobacterales bacterium]
MRTSPRRSTDHAPRPPARVAALVVALARAPGERFTPALAEVRGRPLYAWSVDRLAGAPAISLTRVLLPARQVPHFQRIAEMSGWLCVEGVAVHPPVVRPANVLYAQAGSLDNAIEFILVHDAAYPLLDARTLDAVLAAGNASHLTLAATLVQDTLKQVDEHGLVTGSPPRDRLWQVRSPVLAPRALLESRLRALTLATPATASPATGWLRVLCAGLPARVVPIAADAPHVHTRADAQALAEVLRVSGAG